MTPIRVLHLEDSPRDAEIIEQNLAAGGLSCDTTSVNGKEGFEAALDREAFDLILCDYSLPDYDGMSALTLARKKQPEAPVIVITGVLNDEEAVQCLKNGATDYLLKTHLERLVPAVRRALREAEEHQTRQKVEEALRMSEIRFRQLAEHSSEIFWFYGLNPERALYLSPAIERVWGMPAARFYDEPRLWLAAIHPDDRARVLEAYQSWLAGHAARFEEEYRVVRPDGSVRWVQDSGTLLHNEAGQIINASGIARDITEKKQLETKFLRAQRMESIGTLAAGVAHDLNNILAPILMSLELFRMKFTDEASLRLIDTLQRSAQRGADIVKQILSFARGVSGERTLVQLKHLIADQVKISKETFPPSIQIRKEVAGELWPVLGDATQLHQVLMNLCVNARDAMPSGGTLTLKAENVTLDNYYAQMRVEANCGPYVAVTVRDTGTGIPPEIRERIFDPFFTTKEAGKGTGLGLSTVLGIVKGHGGFVNVYSEAGRGTEFKVYLPAALTEETQQTVAQQRKPPVGKGELVLVVDDEQTIREITRAALETNGYRVVTASDGTEAVAAYAQRGREISLVVTDMAMPFMDGVATIRALQKMNPGLNIIAVSGMSDNAKVAEVAGSKNVTFLHKPYSAEKLLTQIHEVLRGQATNRL